MPDSLSRDMAAKPESHGRVEGVIITIIIIIHMVVVTGKLATTIIGISEFCS